MSHNRLAAAAIFSALATVAFAVSSAFALAADNSKDAGKKEPAKTELKTIKPEEAKDYEGKEVAVEFKVADGVKAAADAKADAKSDSKSTAAADAKSDAKSAAKGIEKPADFFKGKTVRVTGKVKKFQEKFEIEVSSPDQIAVLAEKADDKKSEKK